MTHARRPDPHPGQTVGPFFHYALPCPATTSSSRPAAPTRSACTASSSTGPASPVPDALLEIRQADAAGGRAASRARCAATASRSPASGGRPRTRPGATRFTTVEPGRPPRARRRSSRSTVFARGLLDRLFTRAYLPGARALDDDPLLAGLDAGRRRDAGRRPRTGRVLRFDIHLQGEGETVFLRHPRH